MSRAAAGSPQRSCAPAFSGFANIAAGDLQGRSLLLGPPTIVRVQHSQPHMILGMPPSHVDWVTPIGGRRARRCSTSATCSAASSRAIKPSRPIPDQSSRQSTTGYTQSIFASVTGGYQWGSAQTTGATSVSVTVSAGNMWQNSVTKGYRSYTSQKFDASSQTGLDDEVWFLEERHNMYVYPVIGQVACPADNANCSDPQPLNVIFSGPDNVHGSASARWHRRVVPARAGAGQRVLLSVEPRRTPGSVSKPGHEPLGLSTPTTFYTDSSTLTAQAQWQAGAGPVHEERVRS